MAIQLPPGSQIEIILPPFSILPNIPEPLHDIATLLCAALSYPQRWPTAKAQHLAIINRKLELEFPQNPNAVNTGWTPSRQQRRAQERRLKKGRR